MMSGREKEGAGNPPSEEYKSEKEVILGMTGYLIRNIENIGSIALVAFIIAGIFLWGVAVHYLFDLSYLFSFTGSIALMIVLIIPFFISSLSDEIIDIYVLIFLLNPLFPLGVTIHYFFDLSYIFSFIMSIISVGAAFAAFAAISGWIDKKIYEFEFVRRTLADLERELSSKDMFSKMDVRGALVGRAVLKSEEAPVREKVLKLLHEFITFRSVENITYAKTELIDLLESKLKDENVITGFTRLKEISSILEKSEESLSSTDKLTNLTKALSLLDEIENFAMENLAGLIQNSFICIADSWRKAVYNTIESVQGRAVIKAELKTKKVKYDNPVIATLEIKNIGDGVAENIRVRLLPSPDYTNVKPKFIEGERIDSEKVSQAEFQISPRKKEGCKLSFQIEYDDIQRDGKIYEITEKMEFFKVSKEFKEIFPNPYIVGAPLITGDMFYGRKDVLSFIKENLVGMYQNNAIILQGQRRTGKTSVLYRLQDTLGDDYITVLLDMHDMQANDMCGFLYWMSDCIFDSVNEWGIKVKELEESDFKENPTIHFKKYIKEMEENLHDRHLLLMFDEFEALERLESSVKKETNASVFEYLRHLMQHHEKLDFIFSGTYKLDELTSDYYSILFGAGRFKKITFLKKSDVRKLITEPVKKFNVEYDAVSIQKIFEITAGHPYFTQLICQELVNYHNREKVNYITTKHVKDVLEGVIEGGEAHFKFIWDNVCESQRDRLFLSSIARILDEKSEKESSPSALIKDLNELFRKHNIIAERDEIKKVLDKLVKKDILKKMEHERDKYIFKIDLIRLWVSKYRNFDEIIGRIGWEDEKSLH